MKENKMTIGGKIIFILLILLVIGYCLFRFTNIFTQADMSESKYVGTWDQAESIIQEDIERGLQEYTNDTIAERLILYADGSAIKYSFGIGEGIDSEFTDKWECFWREVDENIIFVYDKVHLNNWYYGLKSNGRFYNGEYNEDTKTIDCAEFGGFIKIE